MNQSQDIEIAHLSLRYEHTRIRRPPAVLRMAQSIERFGQLVPVVVVADGIGHVLIDGYLRVKALKKLGVDLVSAQQWPDTEAAALISLLARMQQRDWDLYEQAAILQELRMGHQLSSADIARLVGKDKSWVTRRLMLFDTLSDEMIALVRDGVISAWSAQRVLVPLARANTEHAALVANALKKENIATRKLAVFFDHYKKSNRKTRQNMAEDPHLFLKALEASTADGDAHTLRQGPEGRFLGDLRTVSHILLRLIKAVPQVLYCGQDILQRRQLLTAYAEAAALMQTLSQTIERTGDDQQSKAPANFNHHQAGCKIRHISRLVKVSRNTVRRVIKNERGQHKARNLRHQNVEPLVRQHFSECRQNVVRVEQMLSERYGQKVPYRLFGYFKYLDIS